MKLSYDFYQVSQQLNNIQQNIHKNEQKNASLNDQLVAVQRHSDTPEQSVSQQVATPDKAQVFGIPASVLIKQKLELVQFAMWLENINRIAFSFSQR